MAAQYISDQIKTRGAKGVVDADDIAYSYKTDEIEQITTTVKNTLDSLKSGVSSIEENKNATQQFYNQAVEIKSKIDTLKENISKIVENIFLLCYNIGC